MKRTISAVLLAGGMLSALVFASPASTAAPSDLELGTCENWSVLNGDAKKLVIDELMKTRPDHKYANDPATIVSKVDKGCEVAGKNGSAGTLTIGKIVDELNR